MPDTSLFLSPPVVSLASTSGFTVSIEVSRYSMGRVEWGHAPDQLIHTAVPAVRGLVAAHDRCLVIPVTLTKPPQPHIYYRVLAEELTYDTTWQIHSGTPTHTAVRQLKLPSANQESITLAVINDTHNHPETLAAIATRIQAIDPDLLVWNGDACNMYKVGSEPVPLLLRNGATPGSPSDGGWASTRPLIFVTGNHDLRGDMANQLPTIFPPSPHPGLPYNTATRLGPLAIIGLDSGEDKPDNHPFFAGTAAYEPYRQLQATWLATQLKRPQIATAPFKIVFSHIPLRGLPGDNDGTTQDGYAAFSGHGAKLWLPHLIDAGCHAIISGHVHQWRSDPPTAAQPITQLTGGGPHTDSATIILIQANPTTLTITTQNLAAETLTTNTFTASPCTG